MRELERRTYLLDVLLEGGCGFVVADIFEGSEEEVDKLLVLRLAKLVLLGHARRHVRREQEEGSVTATAASTGGL